MLPVGGKWGKGKGELSIKRLIDVGCQHHGKSISVRVEPPLIPFYVFGKADEDDLEHPSEKDDSGRPT